MSKPSSFMPEDYIEKRVARRTNAICLSLFAVVMVAVVGAFFVTDRQRSDVAELQAQVNLRYEDAARRLEQLDELQQRKQAMVRKAKVTSALVERIPRSVLLAELVNLMPASLSLIEFDMTVLRRPVRHATAMERARQRATKKADADKEPEIKAPETEVGMVLIGLAPTDVQVAQFMSSLGRSDMFYDVNLQFSEEMKHDDQLVRKFRIELKLDQEVELGEIAPDADNTKVSQNPLGDELQFDPNGQLVMPDQPVASVDTSPQGE